MTTTSQPVLLIATRNLGKVREFAQLLDGVPLRVLNLAEFPDTTEVEETGATFAENALLKARLYAAQTGVRTLADDSGLEVDALGGAPGVYSARYAGTNASDAERTARLLVELKRSTDARRRARFVCVIALFNPDGEHAHTFTGTCEGTIATAPRGSHGFGYDPIFVPDGYTQTFGELPREVKQDISHRSRALRAALEFLREDVPKDFRPPSKQSVV